MLKVLKINGILLVPGFTLLIQNLSINMAGEQAKESKQKADFTDVANGPLTEANRQCRDVICCILFLANVVAMFYCAIQGWANGDTSKIFRATNSNGDVCGEKGGVAQDYPYAYFYKPVDSTNYRYCVQSCPVNQQAPTCYPSCAGVAWTYISSNGSFVLPGITSGSGLNLIYESDALLDRICIPSTATLTNALSGIVNNLSNASNTGTFGNFINDLKQNWKWLLAALGFAVVVSFIWMFSLRCLAGCIVWTSILGLILGIVALGVIFIYNSGKLASFSAMSYVGYLGLPTASENANYDIYAYICWGIAGLLFIILLCCCSRIRLAVAVCKCAGQFVARVCGIVLVPIWQTLFVIVLWVAAIIAIIWLAASATYVARASNGAYDVFTSVSSYADEKLIYLYYFIFGTLWTNALFQAMGIFVIASACAMWYYAHGPGQELDSPILRSYKMVFRYHMGSLAFGSLILAIVQFLQLMVEAFKKQAEAQGADKNKCFEYVINCIRCCLACVQRIVQFINKTAYIQIAIRGKNFCGAAFDGFDLVWSNAMRYSVVGGVGEILMFLGKMMISALTAFAFYCLVTYVKSIAATIFEPILLLIIVFIIGYAVSTLFMAVYSIAMDTLLACFIIDENNQKSKGGKAPLYAPQELAELIDRDE